MERSKECRLMIHRVDEFRRSTSRRSSRFPSGYVSPPLNVWSVSTPIVLWAYGTKQENIRGR